MEGAAAGQEAASAAGHSSKLFLKTRASQLVLHEDMFADSTARACVLAGHLTVVAAAALLAVQIAAKFLLAESYLLQHNTLAVANTCVACLCLAALLGCGAAYAVRVAGALRAGKAWSARQRRVVPFMGAQLAVQLVNSGCYLAANAIVLASPCAWFLVPVYVLAFVRWSCWAVLLTLMVVQARSLHMASYALHSPLFKPVAALFDRRWPAPKSVEHGELVLDLPIWVHLPAWLILWLPAQAAAVLELLYQTGVIGSAQVCSATTDPGCAPAGASPALPCTNWNWTCAPQDRGLYWGITATFAAVLLLALGVYLTLMRLAAQGLSRLPYLAYHEANLTARFQKPTRFVMVLLCGINIVFMWLVDMSSCNSYMLLWLGLGPMHLLMTCFVVLNAVKTIPMSPMPRQLRLYQHRHKVQWLEQPGVSAAAEAGGGGAKYGRGSPRSSCSGGGGGGSVEGRGEEEPAEPVFCFEAALKCLYWSLFSYRHKEDMERGSPINTGTALGLFGLQHFETFWAQELDAKCLLGWGPGTIVIAFRGTASMQNALSDLKFWRCDHPPARGSAWLGTRPKVHQGWWETYVSEGMDQWVRRRVRKILAGPAAGAGTAGAGTAGAGTAGASTGTTAAGAGTTGASADGGECGGSGRWRVLLTGHSLGAALATMAAWDIVQDLRAQGGPAPRVQVQLYAVGGPRLGSAAFAREFRAVVPDSWNVVHANDVIAGYCLLGIVKSHWNRVLVTPTGDLLVRPSYLERTLHKGPMRSATAHFMPTYARSFAAVIRGHAGMNWQAQHGERGGLAELQLLAAKPHVQGIMATLLMMRQESLWRLRKRSQAAPAPAVQQGPLGAAEAKAEGAPAGGRGDEEAGLVLWEDYASEKEEEGEREVLEANDCDLGTGEVLWRHSSENGRGRSGGRKSLAKRLHHTLFSARF